MFSSLTTWVLPNRKLGIQLNRAESQVPELSKKLRGHNGVGCSAVVHEKHSHRCIPHVRVGEGIVGVEGNGVVSRVDLFSL